MHTYHLKITGFPNSDAKEAVKLILQEAGFHEYVESEQFDLDVELDYSNANQLDELCEAYFTDSPIVLYSSVAEELLQLSQLLKNKFSSGNDALHGIDISLGQMDEKVWKEGWKDHIKAVEIGRFRVCPPWLASQADSGLALDEIVIDPGMAFGTGMHETTQLCLAAIEKLHDSGFCAPEQEQSLPEQRERTVLDVGTGSGVLLVACKYVGLPKLFGCDIEPSAVAQANRNLKKNATEAEVFLGSFPLTGELKKFDKEYDLMLMNILFVVIDDILEEAVKNLREGGRIILSGITSFQKDDLDALLNRLDLNVLWQKEKNQWLCLTVERRRPSPV